MNKDLNSSISQLAILESIDFRNIGSQLLIDDGTIDESLFTDGLHPNRKGYMVLAKELQGIISNR